MAVVKCEKCGKEFQNERGLRVHMGIAHSSKPKAKRKVGKGKGKYTCRICGRSFKMAMHLARHMSVTHGKKAQKKVKKTQRRVVRKRKTAAVTVGVPRGINVNALSIDQLLAMKKAVDGRLIIIARKMRQIKLHG